jgi:hypothetical protein
MQHVGAPGDVYVKGLAFPLNVDSRYERVHSLSRHCPPTNTLLATCTTFAQHVISHRSVHI